MPPPPQKKRSVLITGCSEGGIGAALAAEFDRRGCRVFATARDVTRMAALARAHPDIRLLALDVTSDASIAAAVAAVGAELTKGEGEDGGDGAAGPGLDILVNNAGVNHVMPFADCAAADLRRVVETNLIGALVVTHAFLPLLLLAAENNKNTSNKESGGGGGPVVASVGSVNEVFHPPYQAAYNASKAAVHAAARSLRVELAPLGVRLVTLVTGSVRSRLFDNAPTRLPEGSLYGALREPIEGRAFLKNARWVEPEAYARRAVGELLRDRPRRSVWAGGLATVAWVLSWLGWEGMLDWVMIKGNHLDKIKI
ncbi:NADPH-dependent 1-acyl dihydroxyacetone phosphate reductase [Diatrype stigma]|uniref:NADPH-dependent 1-acyl dihydroxyacetone phosphate reductase n=1 Tax=Diatrype stigma TaxID=117547 RepID=A0AAN9UJ10_9PEZI